MFKNALNIPIRFAQNLYQNNETNLAPGVGYFVKYSDDVDKTIAGSRIRAINENSFATRLYDGWNTIGSLSYPTSTQNVSVTVFGNSGTFPEIVGDIYGYVTNRGYQAVTEIEPGLGYWMKVKGSAYLNISAGKGSINSSVVRENVEANATRVTVSDAENNMGNVFVAAKGIVDNKMMFELPPTPPNNLFDVRFTSQTSVEDEANPTIQIQGVTFPVTVTINNPSQNYTVVNPISGAVLGTAIAGRTNSVTITDSRTPYIRLMGQEANVETLNVVASPNPVSANGVVNVTVPSNGHVTVALYDAVGTLVSTLVDEVKTTGVYGVDFNAANLAQGRYIIKATVNGVTATSAVTVVR